MREAGESSGEWFSGSPGGMCSNVDSGRNVNPEMAGAASALFLADFPELRIAPDREQVPSHYLVNEHCYGEVRKDKALNIFTSD